MTLGTSRDADAVRRMFGAIAGRYDLLNRVLSLRRDVGWRREAAEEVSRGAETPTVLDLCGGTGDLTAEIALRQPGSTVVCCDFSHPMLLRAPGKFARRGIAGRCILAEADGLRLPFRRDAFDAVTVAFGVRNLKDLDHGLREMLRVLRPGGRLVVLEFSQPRTPIFARLYRFYLNRLLPVVGGRISGRDGPYGYLARTISDFPEAETLAGRIREAGFSAVSWRTLTFGVVAIHTALKGPG